VADDASRDATRAIAAAHPVVTRVVDAGGRGPGAARNAAVAASTAPVLAFTDADCAPEPGWLRAGLAALRGAGVVQGRVVPAGPAGPYDRTLWVTRLSGLFETANLLTTRAAFDAAGGFEPWLAPTRSKELGEDVWLGWRLVRAGARPAFAPEAVVRHAVEPRGPRGYVAERLRARFFPALVARVPELRGAFLTGRAFLSPRSALFDLALAGLLVRRPLLVVPYLAALARAGPRRAPVEAAADAVTCAALVAGSARSRCLVL
jgi:glycosyltransferase involved in cell wall biosynthesis